MANRHSNKKLRADVRARMASTGESHQTALRHVLARPHGNGRARKAAPDLIATRYFGVPVTLAAFEILSQFRLVLVSGTTGPIGLPWSNPSPMLTRSEGVQ